MNEQRSLSLNHELWLEIDKQRGDVSRSKFISKILAKVITTFKEKSNSSKTKFQTSSYNLQ